MGIFHVTLTFVKLEVENVKMVAPSLIRRNFKNSKLFDLDLRQQILVFQIINCMERPPLRTVKERTAGYTFLSRSISNRFLDFQSSKLKDFKMKMND